MSGLKEKNYQVGKPVGKLIFDKLKSPVNKAFFRFCTMPPTGLEPVTHRLRVYCSTN